MDRGNGDAQLLVYGAGELGGRVGAVWVGSGHGPCRGHTATSSRHGLLRRLGLEGRLGDVGRDDVGAANALLISLPGHGAQAQALERLKHFPVPARAVFISTVGVFGAPWGTVNEGTSVGADARARAVWAGEEAFRDWAGEAGVVVRLGGLYRPGRGPLSALRRRAKAPVGPPDRTLSLIHYDDAAQAVYVALHRPRPAPLYVAVVTPCPSRRAFYRSACAQLGLAPPQFSLAAERPRASYDTALLRADLLPDPTYPDWRAALL
jgi:hypothetical protein